MTDTPKFRLGDMVWHRTCGDDAGVIIAMIYRPNCLLYQVSWAGRCVDDHYEIELTSDRPFFSSSGGATKDEA
jgi:hypothetical protein